MDGTYPGYHVHSDLPSTPKKKPPSITKKSLADDGVHIVMEGEGVKDEGALIPEWASNILKYNNLTKKNKVPLNEFLTEKSAIDSHGKPDEKRRLEIVKQNSVKTVGKENWIIGLVGMIYDRTNQNPALISALIGQIGPFLTENDLFFVVSVLKGFLYRASELNKQQRNAVLQFISDDNFSSYIKNLKPNSYEHRQIINVLTALFTKMDRSELLNKFIQQEKVPLTVKKYSPVFTPFQKEQYANNYKIIVATRLSYLSLIKSNFTQASKSAATLLSLINIDHIESFLFPKPLEIDLKRIAIVTDYPLVELTRYPYIYTVEIDPIRRIKIFFDKFKELLDRGFGQILVILPDGHFWTSCYFAKHASHQMEQFVKIIDSKTFALGLKVVIQEIAHYIYDMKHSQYIDQTLDKLVSSVRYWVIPASTEPIKTRMWYKKMMKGRRFSKKKPVPLVSFREPLKIVNFFGSALSALSHLESLIDQEYHVRQDQKMKVIVAYKSMYPEAMSLIHQLKQKDKNIRFRVVPASPYAVKKFGTHLGVCII